MKSLGTSLIKISIDKFCQVFVQSLENIWNTLTAYIKTTFTLEQKFTDSLRIRDILISDSLCRLHLWGRIRYKIVADIARIWKFRIQKTLWDLCIRKHVIHRNFTPKHLVAACFFLKAVLLMVTKRIWAWPITTTYLRISTLIEEQI